jgi:prepilin-type N-terminal cleavage/methylation domain-containing protein/prepilin-type processing-associated H-X9-DG protein
MKRIGFTLIELLVVIAIIAILAAILFPVFARARAKAQQNTCLSNVKELQLGLNMYVSDYDDRWPNVWQVEHGTGNQGYSWLGMVFPYTKNAQIILCPSDTAPYTPSTWAPYDQTIYGTNAASYGYNGTIENLTNSAITYPAECLGVTDTSGNLMILRGWTPYFTTGSTVYPYIASAARHNLGSNMSYLDGHAKWNSIASLPDVTVSTMAAMTTAGAHFFWGQDP